MITEKIFTRGNGEKVRYSQIGSIVADYIAKAPNASYEITVGSDSQNHKCTRMVEVIAVHRIGDGGIFFYRKQDIPKIRVLKTKIQEETSRSIENATGFVDALAYALIDYDIDLEQMSNDGRFTFAVHADIGHAGKTNQLITEITSWIKTCGFEVAIKPDSYAASGIANRITK